MAGTRDPEAVADVLVKSGIVTQYQANQLRDGRTKLTLGPYLITDFIGQGGMGRVFKAVHQVMGRECAVKVLPREKSTHESRDSFRREIRVQAGLDSPHVVRAFDAGQDGKVHYLVTEYVPGTDLRRLVRGQGPLSMGEAALIISQVAMGLQYAHDLGLIHRDIKPGNILVTPDGHAKLSDIGLAAWSMGLQDDPRAGKIVGTADYLSPEQIRDPMSVGPLSDIYALGCTLYYTVTGKVPFPGGDSRSKCRRHCEETPWHPRNLTPDLSEDFVDTIADMMEKDPIRRIQSAAEVAERLEPWASAAPQSATVRSLPPTITVNGRRRHRPTNRLKFANSRKPHNSRGAACRSAVSIPPRRPSTYCRPVLILTTRQSAGPVTPWPSPSPWQSPSPSACWSVPSSASCCMTRFDRRSDQRQDEH